MIVFLNYLYDNLTCNFVGRHCCKRFKLLCQPSFGFHYKRLFRFLYLEFCRNLILFVIDIVLIGVE